MGEKEVANALYHAYVRFFGKKPELKGDKNELTIDFQTMTYLLSQYGVSFMRNSFIKEGYTDMDIPMSMEIQDVLVSHVFGHEESEFERSVEFNKHTNRILDILSHELEFVSSRAELCSLVKLMFTKERVIPASSDDELCQTTGATQENLESYKNFVVSVIYEMMKDEDRTMDIDTIREELEYEPYLRTFRPVLNEAGNGDKPNITEESRKKAAHALVR